MLQSKAGYIDARPLTASSAKPLATHGRTIQMGQKSEVAGLARHVRSTLNSRHGQAGPARPKSARHEVAALQPAAREQEPRGLVAGERTATPGWQGQHDQPAQCWRATHDRARVNPDAASYIIGRTDNAMIKNCLDESANQFA